MQSRALGLCREFLVGTEGGLFHPQTLRSQGAELLGKGQPRTAGVLRLSFAHHVNHLDPAQDHTSAANRPELEHRPNPALASAMILFDPIVEVGTLPDPDRLELPS